MLETLETPVHSPEKKLVLKAISDSPGKISVADIATKTSLPVLQATALLNQIAYETGGHLTVGTAGSIAYEFDRNFQSSYLAKSSKNFFLRMMRIAYNSAVYLARLFSLLMFFLIRVSFGIILVASVVLVVVLVVMVVLALLARMMGSDNDSGPDFDFGDLFRGMGGIFRYWAFDWLWDWWYWGSYIRWDPSPSPSGTTTIKDKESFLDKCFSFLFGDGDPNQGLLERQWQMLALAIKQHRGVVTADELAPYVDIKGKGEDWVLPILVQFNGSCDVSENGNIIYSFPSFQQSLPSPAKQVQTGEEEENLHTVFQNYLKSKSLKQTGTVRLESYLKEHPWIFSHVTGGSRTTIIAFAVFILFAGIWLTTMTAAFPFLFYLSPLLLAISAYGAMFLIVPAIRHLIIQERNKGIEKRNSLRYTMAMKLQNPDPELRTKLTEAEQMRKNILVEANKEGVAYSTEKDLLEQEFEP